MVPSWVPSLAAAVCIIPKPARLLSPSPPTKLQKPASPAGPSAAGIQVTIVLRRRQLIFLPIALLCGGAQFLELGGLLHLGEIKSRSRSAKHLQPAWVHTSSHSLGMMQTPSRAGFKVNMISPISVSFDLSGAAQGDGAGGDWGRSFQRRLDGPLPHLLATRPDYQVFFKGARFSAQTAPCENSTSPRRRQCSFAKPARSPPKQAQGMDMLTAKASPLRHHKRRKQLAFAAYVNHVCSLLIRRQRSRAVQALGEIVRSRLRRQPGWRFACRRTTISSPQRSHH